MGFTSTDERWGNLRSGLEAESGTTRNQAVRQIRFRPETDTRRRIWREHRREHGWMDLARLKFDDGSGRCWRRVLRPHLFNKGSHPGDTVCREANWILRCHRKKRYTIGTALDDLPQYSDSLENRSSRAFKCRNIANLVFAIPRVKTSQFIGRVRPA